MSSILPLTTVCPSLGSVNIPNEEVEQVVSFLRDQANLSFKRHLVRWLKKESKGKIADEIFYTSFIKNESLYTHLFSYPDDLKRSETRYRADLHVYVSDLEKIQEPLKSFLRTFASKVEQIFSNFLHWRIDLRFEQGMLYTQQEVEYFHHDTFAASVTTCYSNVEGWTTKVVNPAYYHDLNLQTSNLGPSFYHSLQEKLKIVEEDSKFGELQNVNNVIHRGPNKSDLSRDLGPNDYRLFIRMRSEFKK